MLGCVKGNYSDAIQGIFENCAVNELDHVAYIQNALGTQLCTIISVLGWPKPGHHHILIDTARSVIRHSVLAL